MASIVTRKNKYSVVYSYTDEPGAKKQKWETYDKLSDAKKRKTEIEYQQNNNTFVIPTSDTLSDLMGEYFKIYGATKWSMTTHKHNVALYNNYIKPLIGHIKITNITTGAMNNFYQELLVTKAVSTNCRRARTEFVLLIRLLKSTNSYIAYLNRLASGICFKRALVRMQPFQNQLAKSVRYGIWIPFTRHLMFVMICLNLQSH